MKNIKYFVSRDYGDGCYVTVADFYDEQDAREYYEWKKRTTRDCDWIIGKTVTCYDDNGKFLSQEDVRI